MAHRPHAYAEEASPLHDQIDALITKGAAGVVSATVDDAEFLRRVSLDLIGMPPSVAELKAFIADESPSKREAAIDRLLAHPRYAYHMAEVLDVMLMERRPYQHVTADDWHSYLRTAIRENRPFNELAREILAADGADPSPRAAARFYLDRQADPNLITRDVGRIFFGKDLQCAQCHDHPIISDYHQADYQGLLAVFNSSFAFAAPAPDGKTYYAEKAGTEIVYESVFIKGEKHKTGAKVLGMPEMIEPPLFPDELYTVKPADGVRPVPKFSRRQKLAELATSGASREFNENIANRFWAHMFGMGLINPVDLHHSGNPPSNPELLRMLGDHFAASKFNVRSLLREIALSATYQRSVEPPEDPFRYVPQAIECTRELDAQLELQTAAADAASEQLEKASEEFSTVEEAAAPVEAELEQATAAATTAIAKLDEAKQQLAAAEAQVAAKNVVNQALSEAVTKTQEVAKALPQDQELLAATQKFAERQQQVAAEVATLTEDAKKKSAAVAEPTAAVATARTGIESIRAKFAPLAAAIQEKQSVLVEARKRWTEHESRRLRSEQQIDAAQILAGLQANQEAIAAARKEVTARRARLLQVHTGNAAEKLLLGEKWGICTVAQASMVESAAALDAATNELRHWQGLIAKLEKAIAETEAARQSLPGDAGLTQVVATLTAKLAELKSDEQVRTQIVADATASLNAAKRAVSKADDQMAIELVRSATRMQAERDAYTSLETAQALVRERVVEFDEALTALNSEWTKAFGMLPLKPLSPEQLCWSIFRVTGVYDRYVAAERTELDKASPLSDEDKKDPAKLAAREADLEQRVYDKLKGNVASFVALYAPAAGQPQADFFATANQALFTANGGAINSWVAPAGGNVSERMLKEENPQIVAEDLYLTVLNRPPDPVEAKEVAEYLAARPQERADCVKELVWALLTSVEFRFNH